MKATTDVSNQCLSAQLQMGTPASAGSSSDGLCFAAAQRIRDFDLFCCELRRDPFGNVPEKPLHVASEELRAGSN